MSNYLEEISRKLRDVTSRRLLNQHAWLFIKLIGPGELRCCRIITKKARFSISVLCSDKAWALSQSELSQLPIYIIIAFLVSNLQEYSVFWVNEVKEWRNSRANGCRFEVSNCRLFLVTYYFLPFGRLPQPLLMLCFNKQHKPNHARVQINWASQVKRSLQHFLFFYTKTIKYCISIFYLKTDKVVLFF